jgi:hypothetical protein
MRFYFRSIHKCAKILLQAMYISLKSRNVSVLLSLKEAAETRRRKDREKERKNKLVLAKFSILCFALCKFFALT